VKKALIPLCTLYLILGIIEVASLVTLEMSEDLSPVVAIQKAVADQTGVVYHGNVSSKIFHRPSCRYYNCKNCTAVFNTREEAINAGYRPCKICKP